MVYEPNELYNISTYYCIADEFLKLDERHNVNMSDGSGCVLDCPNPRCHEVYYLLAPRNGEKYKKMCDCGRSYVEVEPSIAVTVVDPVVPWHGLDVSGVTWR